VVAREDDMRGLNWRDRVGLLRRWVKSNGTQFDTMELLLAFKHFCRAGVDPTPFLAQPDAAPELHWPDDVIEPLP
jgi:hypothetical protein